jgi:hypothetical protein
MAIGGRSGMSVIMGNLGTWLPNRDVRVGFLFLRLGFGIGFFFFALTNRSNNSSSIAC